MNANTEPVCPTCGKMCESWLYRQKKIAAIEWNDAIEAAANAVTQGGLIDTDAIRALKREPR